MKPRAWTSGSWLLLAAAGAGSVHALPSLVWATGQSWGLSTVGDGAVELQRESPIVAAIILGTAGGAKLCAGWLPFLGHQGLVPWSRLWRALAWPGSVLLISWGWAYADLSWLSLRGFFGAPTDPGGYRGHLYFWDPLFVLWGTLLLLGLLRSRSDRRRPSELRAHQPARHHRHS